jgi:hypothetical protein
MRWEQILSFPDLHRQVLWAKPKTFQRSVEKLYRCYSLDVSRLLDCCRWLHDHSKQRLICGNVHSVTVPWFFWLFPLHFIQPVVKIITRIFPAITFNRLWLAL